jgi:hypothetical protein
MWDINEIVEDYSRPNGKSYINLNSNNKLDPYHISYPISWTGFVNSKPIKIIQKGQTSSSVSDYDFTEFPEEYLGLRASIVGLIDKKLRILD